mmetsp:Transcript_126735/g.224511  ORF Transcript_126735/g.224511 Transcript_126735/m.224511 type:complete len:882 (+) Transcript_126735:114-2759(+)
MPETKKRVLLMLQDQLMQILHRKEEDNKFHQDAPHEDSIKRVETALNKMEKWIERQSARPSASAAMEEGPMWGAPSDSTRNSKISRVFSSVSAVRRMGSKAAKASHRASHVIVDKIKRLTHRRLTDLKNCQEILEILSEVKEKFININSAHLRLLGELPDLPTDEQEAQVIKVVANDSIIDKQMVRAMHEVFLNLMYSNYWNLIDAGEVVPGTNEADVVLTSIKLALSSTKLMLTDFENIRVIISERVQHKERGAARGDAANVNSSVMYESEGQAQGAAGKMTRANRSRSLLQVQLPTEKITRLVDSTWFNTVCMVLIMSNACFIALEDNYQNETNKADLSWLIADIIFTTFFFIEFVIKYLSLGFSYFRDWWNVADFFLVIMSIIGVILGFMAAKDAAIETAGAADVSAEGRLVRLARVFRVMRLMRLFRLVGFFRLLKAKLTHMEFSKHVAEQMQILTILTCFIKAHMKSQKEILHYFGNGMKIDLPELARCVLESQVETYRALSLAVDCVQKLDEGMLLEVNNQKKSKALAEELEHLVQHAHLHHVITAQEAESVLDPVREHLRHMQSRIWEMHFGYVRGEASTKAPKNTPRSTETMTAPPSRGASEMMQSHIDAERWVVNGQHQESSTASTASACSQQAVLEAPPTAKHRGSNISEDTKGKLLKAAHLKHGMTDSIFQDILPDGRISYRSLDDESEVGVVDLADPGEASVLGRQSSPANGQGSPSTADGRGSPRMPGRGSIGSLHSTGRQAEALRSPGGVEVLDLSESEANHPNVLVHPSGHANGGLKPLGVKNGLPALDIAPLPAECVSRITPPARLSTLSAATHGDTSGTNRMSTSLSELQPEYTSTRSNASGSLCCNSLCLSDVSKEARWRRRR